MTRELLYKDLSYVLQGVFIDVRQTYGAGHKESLYQHALVEEFSLRNIAFQREPSIAIHSPKTGKTIGIYRPDFLVEEKIIVEIKAIEVLPKMLINQLFDYLRNSIYELGYFVNFSGPKLYMKRIIYTNDRKDIRGI